MSTQRSDGLRGNERPEQDDERSRPVPLGKFLIHWIESANNHVCVHCGRATHIARETLSSVEQRLPAGRFLRIHRSVIVNASQVREVAPLRNGDYRIVLKDGTPLTLSRTFKDKLPSLLS